MSENPIRFSQQTSSNKHLSKSQIAHPAQHVLTHAHHLLPVFRTGGLGSSEFTGSPLHALPFETVANVTAWLDPPSLLALGLVDKYLKRYVDNDSIWRTAFLAHFLDIAPEDRSINRRVVLLRLTENSWKREYISRYKLLQRWNRSKATTTTHIPLMLPVTSMHLLNERQSLVCFSADFGIAVRTLPATGKILKGRLLPFNPDPTGPLWPRPSLCSIVSEGGTIKFAWGTQTGEALYTNVPKAMETSNRRNGRSLRCSPPDQHQGAVNHIAWATTKAPENEYFTTAGSDGSVKIWNIDQCQVHWQSVTRTSPCILAVFDLHARIVVAAYRKGDIMLYQNVELGARIADIQEDMVLQIPDIDAQSPDNLILDTTCPNGPTVLTHFDGDSHAWRINFNLKTHTVEAARLDGPIAPLTTLEYDFSSTQSRIVYGGDALGYIHVWSGSATGEYDCDGHLHLPAVISWDTGDDLSVSTIRSNGIIVLTGNSRGGIKVWDALKLRLLKVFKTPQPKLTGQATWAPVSNLILDADMLVASVGKYVMYWKAGTVSSNKKTKRPASQRYIGKGVSATQRAIKESQAEFEMTAQAAPRVSTSAREQAMALQKLGLQEAEAVEYALMISHEEALKSGVLTNSPLGDSKEDRKSRKGSISMSASPRSTPLRMSPPLRTPGKVQVAWLEPKSVGGLPNPTRAVSRATSAEEFPSINAGISPRTMTPINDKAKNKKQGGVSSAKSSPPKPTKPTTLKWSEVARDNTKQEKGGKKIPTTIQSRPPPPITDEEAQLQFALELSLAEAFSEGPRGD